jgi:hypothetical protein
MKTTWNDNGASCGAVAIVEFAKATHALYAILSFFASPSFAFKEKETKAKFCSRFQTLTGHMVLLIRSRLFLSKELDGRNQTRHFFPKKQRKPDKRTCRLFLLSFPSYKYFSTVQTLNRTREIT